MILNLIHKKGDDFYQFTCGNYMKDVDIPSDKSDFNQFKTLDRELRAILAGKFN